MKKRQRRKINMSLPSREDSKKLLNQCIKNEALVHHSEMVALAMEKYAVHLGEDKELWYHTGLLHDLDWEMYPDEHPNRAINEWLAAYPEELKLAIAEHAPERTGKQATSLMGKYLFACDEVSGFMHAVSLMRPEKFVGMKASSITKKLKDKGFAKNVSRDDIYNGVELIGKPLDEHLTFLIAVFQT